MAPPMLLNTILLALTPLLAQGHITARLNYKDQSALAKYTQTIFLPFTSKFSSDSTPSVSASINGQAFTLPVDTGSTGVMIGAPLLPNVKLSGNNAHKYERGWEFLDSSSLLHVGRFVPLNITFQGANQGETAVSEVPVLVVQSVIKCPGYRPTTGQGRCPKANQVRTSHTAATVTYMGVGFGRNTEGSGIDFGTPDYNPFLNIDRINGRKPSRFRNGYSVSTDGVYLGLTNDNTHNAVWTHLDYGVTDDPRDWAEANMSFSVNGKGNYQGALLVDTGIPQMYLQAAPAGKLPSVNVPNPDPDATYRYRKRVRNGTHLDFAFPNFDRPVAGYDFDVGDLKFPSQPEYVQPVTGPSAGPFVNTGRTFLNGFTILFDAVGGRFGFICLKCNEDGVDP